MTEPIATSKTIPAGETIEVELQKDARYTKTTVSVKAGETGVLSFRGKVLSSQYEVPEAPNTLDIAERKSIHFEGAPLEALEVTNAGAGPVTLVIWQIAA